MAPPPRATEHIGHHIEPQTRVPEDQTCCPTVPSSLDVLPDGAALQPQASLLPQPQGISSLHLTSLSFSLLHIRVIGLMGFCLSQSLSLYLRNESEMK